MKMKCVSVLSESIKITLKCTDANGIRIDAVDKFRLLFDSDSTFTSISARSTSSASRCLTDDDEDEEERGNNFIHLVLIEMNYVYSVRSFIIFGSLCVCVSERRASILKF